MISRTLEAMNNERNRAILGWFVPVVGIVIIGAIDLGRYEKAHAPVTTPSPTALSDVPSLAHERAFVTKIVQADTLVVTMNDDQKTVRLIGVKAPEYNATAVQASACYGQQAFAYAKQLLLGKIVAMASDIDQQDMDIDGNLLRYLYLPGGLFVNQSMIRQGYAAEYTYDRPYIFQTDFRQAQKEAQEANLGLWASCPSPTT